MKARKKKRTSLGKAKDKGKKPAAKPGGRKIPAKGKKAAGAKTPPKEKGKTAVTTASAIPAKKLRELKKKLAMQREALLSGAEDAMNNLPEQTIFPDPGDQATVESDKNFMLRLKSREQKLIKKIEDAIERVEQGVFGICEVCGEMIDLKRLEARPVTTMCISCKVEQEEEEKLRGR